MLNEIAATLLPLLRTANSEDILAIALLFFPFALVLEFPLTLLVWLGIIRYGLRQQRPDTQRENYPRVTCTLVCYAEGDAVRDSIRSLAHQIYPGFIEILVVIDGAIQNEPTYRAALSAAIEVAKLPNRKTIVVPKWQRGGRVSSDNVALNLATGDIFMGVDGDTSFDNDMVEKATRHFDDPNVVGVSGNLRVRNARHSLATRLQAMEYMLSISAGKTGLSEFNIVNAISGAFGVFRTSFIRIIGGWDSGAAEDLDMTIRIKQYFGRNPDLRIVFEPKAIGHTDVPDSFIGFFKQRWRWDGDLFYIFWRKYRFNINPRLLGWRNFLFTAYTGIIQQLLLSFVIAIYTIWMFWFFPLPYVIGLGIFIYAAYFIVLAIQFFLYVLLVSERVKEDLAYVIYLPIYPLFSQAARINSAFAILQDIFLTSHLDSSMAPWWVLRKTKF